MLGVRYLITGSTQRSDKRARVTVSLLDAMSGTEIWSNHFDRSLDDLFEVQDDITGSVLAPIEPMIERAEMQRALLKPPSSLTAWECFHRGLWHCFRFTDKDNEAAHELFRRAISHDPRFSRAYAGLSFSHFSRAFLRGVDDVESEIDKALEAGRRSVAFGTGDAMAHWALGRAFFLSREHDQALNAVERALAINPNYAQAYYAKGFIGVHAGIDDESLRALDVAERLSPFDPLLFAMKSSRAISLANQGGATTRRRRGRCGRLRKRTPISTSMRLLPRAWSLLAAPTTPGATRAGCSSVIRATACKYCSAAFRSGRRRRERRCLPRSSGQGSPNAGRKESTPCASLPPACLSACLPCA